MHRLLARVILLGLVLAGCSDKRSPTEPVVETGSFEVELPASVIEGEPFQITVTAVSRNGSKPDPTVQGAVTLSASAGGVAPASVSLSQGLSLNVAVALSEPGIPIEKTGARTALHGP